MSSTSTLLNSSDAPGSMVNPSRSISRRRSLPGSRAIVGAFLVAGAAVGTFTLATGTGGHHSQTYLVASHDLDTGSRLQESDLRLVSSEGGENFAHLIHQRKTAVGLTLLGPIKAGELIQSGELLEKDSSPSSVEISFSLPASRALGGNLRGGETVDVLVTNKNQNGGASSTQPAVTGAQVVKVDRGNAGIGQSENTTIVLAVDNAAESQAVANAVDLGQVTLVRTTGTAK